MSEHLEQVSAVNWFEQTYPSARMFAIPNGGLRNAIVAAKMRREGVQKGVPDLFIPDWRLFVEMKRANGGSLSPEQIDWRDYLISIGYRVLVCHGFEDFKRQIQSIAV